jgi:hypothetical protein
MKILLPWLCVVGLGIGLAALYSSNQKQAEELAKLQAESQAASASAEESKKGQTQTENDELVQLRKDHEELLRLRNEVHRLGDQNKLLAKQAAQAATVSAQQQQAQQQLQQLQADNQQLRVQTQQIQQGNQIVGCINNMRQIEAAKQQWALQNQRPAGSLVSAQDLAPFLPNRVLPACPAGGVYTLNPIGINPICNIAGHVLPR